MLMQDVPAAEHRRSARCCGCCCGDACSILLASTLLGLSAFLVFVWSLVVRHWLGAGVGVTSAAVAAVGVALERRCSPGKRRSVTNTYQLVCSVAFFCAMLLLLIRIVCAPSPAVLPHTFPESCYKQWMGVIPKDCCRVAPNATHAQLHGIVDSPATPLFASANAPVADIANAIDAWASSLPQVTVVTRAARGGVLHAVQATAIFGFLDDVFVHALTNASNVTIVLAQSEQRLGSGDGGVNRRRLLALQNYLRG